MKTIIVLSDPERIDPAWIDLLREFFPESHVEIHHPLAPGQIQSQPSPRILADKEWFEKKA